MHWFLVIYLFALFVIFSNNSLFSRAFMFKGKQLPGHLITGFAFALVLYFTYDYTISYYITLFHRFAQAAGPGLCAPSDEGKNG